MLVTLAGVAAASAQPSAGPAELASDAAPLHVTVKGRPYALDALVLRRPGTDKLPVALITHGAFPGNPRALQIGSIKAWAAEMAHRGWLAVAVMRRGYGHSEGETPDDGGPCASPDVGRYLEAHADDLQAALVEVSHRADADMGRVIGIGHSAGGAAMMALAARVPPPLAAVVNVSGGLGPPQLGPFRPAAGCDAYTSDLVWNFARFGATAHMPTLWLYAENDVFFRPGLVSRMRAAFTGSGGVADLVMQPPFGGDGHALFYAPGGRQLLLPELDRFLRANGLPTWREEDFVPLLSGLPRPARWDVDRYLRTAPAEKALALSQSGEPYSWFGAESVAKARDSVLAYCREKSGGECRLAAEGFQLAPGAEGTSQKP